MIRPRRRASTSGPAVCRAVTREHEKNTTNFEKGLFDLIRVVPFPGSAKTFLE